MGYECSLHRLCSGPSCVHTLVCEPKNHSLSSVPASCTSELQPPLPDSGPLSAAAPRHPLPNVFSLSSPRSQSLTVSESFSSPCLILAVPGVLRHGDLPRWSYLLQCVIRGVAEATGTTFQPPGSRHGISLFIQQHLAHGKTHWRGGREPRPQHQPKGTNHHDGVPCTRRVYG